MVGWSPDGGKLLYYRGSPIRHSIVDLGSGQKIDVVWHATGDIHNVRISPDGRWITFTLVMEGSRVIYVAPVAAASKPEAWIRISDEIPAQTSFWSPDGNLLYVHRDGALWAHKLRQDTKTPAGDAILVQRFDGRFRPFFSADGITRDALYFPMIETTANIWIADPVGR